MKSTRLYFILALFAVVLLSSCAPKVPFTQEVRERYKLTNSELQQLQFYTSNDIVLFRGEKSDEQKATEEGKLTIKTGNYQEQVVIKKGTPGVVEKVIDKNRIAVSFEQGNQTYLVFGDPLDRKGNYTLLAADWKNNKGKINYGGETYYTTPGTSNVYLLFKMKRINQMRKKQKVVKGRKL